MSGRILRGACVAAMLLLAPDVLGKAGSATKPSDREQRLAALRDSRANEEAADLFRTADTTYLVGDASRAAELFTRLLTTMPNSSYAIRASARLGDCHYESKRFTDAAQQYRKAAAAAESAANDEEANAGVRADFMVGQSYLQAKMYTQAFSQFRRFIDRHAGHPLVNQCYQAIGDAHLAMEQFQQALRAYRMVGTVFGQKTAAHKRIAPGQRLYLRITDADVNVGETLRSVKATIRTTGGDLETVELEPLGQRSALFIGTIPTALGSPRHSDELKEIFAEPVAVKIRNDLAEAERLEASAKQKTEEAFELDRSAQKTADPAGTERKRSALTAEAEKLNSQSQVIKRQACQTIDKAFVEFEKKLQAWGPDQTLAALMARAASTRPTTAPADDADKSPTENQALIAAAAKPLTGTDEDETQTGPAATAGEQERRGMTENELVQMRIAASKVPTAMDNINARLTALSVWSRSLSRQFQRVEVRGGDRIEVEYYDEIGPNGPNTPQNAIRRDVVEVASDATLEILTRDGREPLSQAVVGAEILLRVEDADGDVSDGRDTLTVTLAAVPITDARSAEVAALSSASTKPTTQRATPGEIAGQAESEPVQPLVPPGCRSITVKLTETGPHTGVFERLITVAPQGVIGDGGAVLPLKSDTSSGGLCAVRAAYRDERCIRHADGWVLAKAIDCVAGGTGEVAAVKYRQTQLDLEAKLRRAIAAGEIGKIYLDLGLTHRGRDYLASAQSDCNEIARAAEKTALGEDALHASWKIYFYAGMMDEAVAACRTLMARYPTSDYIPDAMFAMGQASLELGKRAVEQGKAAGDKAALNRNLTRAVSQFEELAQRFPRSPLAPEALFNVGMAKMAAGQTGLDVFERLAKQYPDSVLAAQGLMQSAEYYLSVNDYRRASDYYSRVLTDYPDSPKLGEVLLQRGVCQYKLGQVAEALQSFYRVVEEQSGTELATKAQKYINIINQKRGGKDE